MCPEKVFIKLERWLWRPLHGLLIVSNHGPCFCLVDAPREGLVLLVTEASFALIIVINLHILHENKHCCYE